MSGRRWLVPTLVVVLGGLAAAAVLAWHPSIAPVPPPAVTAFDASLVKRGATLAAIGNCAGCHSAPGKGALSGGLAVETPFGAIHASNVTPDPETGIGRWSEAAFRRAMREGVDREGRNLYPAFPYDHYTRVTDEDDAALYAYLMTRSPVRSPIAPPELPFPLNVRAVMAGWNLLFFRSGSYASDPRRDAAWNRGAYLVEGLGHCGACHTPHGAFGEEENDRHLAGGAAEGWTAYALDAGSPAPIPWTVDSLSFYLGHGWQADHGVARGPMALVTASLGSVPAADTRAMAVYLVSLMGRAPTDAAAAPRDRNPPPVPVASAGSQIAVANLDAADAAGDPGGAIYAGACASCHASGRPVPYGGLGLALSSAVHAADPSNAVIVTLDGLAAPPEAPGAIMPGFAGALDDGQITALLSYLRAHVARAPPWPNLAATVKAVRSRAVSRPSTIASPTSNARIPP